MEPDRDVVTVMELDRDGESERVGVVEGDCPGARGETEIEFVGVSE